LRQEGYLLFQNPGFGSNISLDGSELLLKIQINIIVKNQSGANDQNGDGE
jgi:hypothetical protein